MLGLNLDSIDQADELLRIANNLTMLADYATNKTVAIEARKSGWIQTAINYEKYCDGLFKKLDTDFKW